MSTSSSLVPNGSCIPRTTKISLIKVDRELYKTGLYEGAIEDNYILGELDNASVWRIQPYMLTL